MTVPASPLPARIELVHGRRLQLAVQQRGRSFVEQLSVHNPTDQPLRDASLHLSLDPPWADPVVLPISAIEPGATLRIDGAAIPFRVRTAPLVEQTERVDGALHAELRSATHTAPPVVSPVEILAWDEWPGSAVAPEYLAAFVTPNHPGTALWLQLARTELGRAAQSTDLEGYQRGRPDRVVELAAAAWAAVRAGGVSYASPPASFEETGQRIRTIDRILAERLGTCLDLTVAIASALEQIGLNPLLVVLREHAFPGVWLRDDALQSAWIDEPSLLRNRVALGEILLFDSSAAAQGGSFRDACASAQRQLDDDDRFLWAVDVRGARRTGIRPLPMVRGQAGDIPEVGGPVDHAATPWALPDLPVGPSVRPGATHQATAPTTRLARWKERLLDLSLNNRLLHQRNRKTLVPIASTLPGRVEDALHGNASLVLTQRPDGLSDAELVETANAALDASQLVASLTTAEFFARCTELYRTARTLEEDTGALPLFLTLGTLRWFESEASSVPREAPILLVPVTLQRDSVRGPFRIRRTDEEPIVNAALLRKLELEYGVRTQGLAQLVEDERGWDIDRTLQNFRLAIRDVPRFEVKPGVTLDLLSFARFLLWSDLEQNVDALRDNPIVQRLLDPAAPAIPSRGAPPAPATLDALPPHDDLSVVDADSTQAAAVRNALQGNTFILQGPPGTGKSQTITNLIAQAIGAGRTVLFVAEKRAALDVVHQRLSSVGLGPFILEAHNEKSTRADVVRQLGEPLDFAWQRSGDEWNTLADELGGLRATLNRHAGRMNEPGPWGETLFRALGELVRLDAATDLSLDIPPEPDRPTVVRLREHIRALQTEAAAVWPVASHPWCDFDPIEWTPQGQQDVQNALRALHDALRALHDAWPDAAAALGTTADPAHAERLAPIARQLLDSPSPTDALLRERPGDIGPWLEALGERIASRRQLAERVEAQLLPSIYEDPNFEEARARLARWARAFFLLAFLFLFGLRRRLRLHARAALPPSPDLADRMQDAARVRAHDQAIEAESTRARALFGARFRGVDTDLAELARTARWVRDFRAELASTGGTPEEADALRRLASEADERLAEGSAARAAVHRFIDAHARVVALRDALSALVRPRTDILHRGTPNDRAATLERLLHTTSTLRDWSLWRAVARQAQGAGLGAFVDALSAGQLVAADLADAFEKSLRRRWINHRFEQDAELRAFRGARHDAVIARFRTLDNQARDVARRELQARIAQRLPDRDAPGQMDVLRRELRKKRGHLPLRRLFADVRDVLLRLKPCVLMSPMTVARHLDPSLPRFDLVVFDEASQIPPWDAVGALARGRQAIIVGDSKQLPPTSFFSTGGDDDATDDDDRLDLESILDHAGASGVPEVLLGWHYRSRHESLIAFSNEKYYDNRLHIFPSPLRDNPRVGVKFVHVTDGFYDRAGTRSNRAEAAALVDALAKRVLDPETADRSIGVVTFSMAQQRCVEDLLDEARRTAPELDAAILRLPEPLFIKNLENVQGDERDVMLFSIGYGPDRHGKVSMGFGPLNREGGERRLNVAVTRARDLLVVFSALRPEHIDLSRTNATGVRHLRAFLDYAIRGTAALDTEARVDANAEWGSPFEADVARRLQHAGWTTRTQVGVAGYRIDLAVVHPDEPGRFVLAIECDGASYHSAATARDRDRLRQAVLERLGWRVHRIWSTDWFHDRERTFRELLAAVEAAVDAAPAATPVIPPSTPRPTAAPILPERVDRDAPPERTWPAHASPWPGLPTLRGGPRERFQLPAARRDLAEQLAFLVRSAGPLTLPHAAQHLARAWNVERVTQGIVEHVRTLARSTPGVAMLDDVLWPNAAPPGTAPFRYHGDGIPADRTFAEVPDAELEAALLWVVERAVSVSLDDACREAARVFGAIKLGSAIRERLVGRVERLVERSLLQRDHDTLRAAPPLDGP